MSQTAPQPTPPFDPAPLAEVDPADQSVLDQALQLVYSEQHRLATRLALQPSSPPTVRELRRSLLGRDLTRLALVARGRAREPRDRVLAAVEDVLQMLFWPTAAEDCAVPPPFWDTALGRLLAQAKYRAFASDELISVRMAARQLGVARPTIHRWLDDRALDWVHDEASGRTYVVRRDVDDRAHVARELTAAD